jgi:hypothetical protein
MGLSLIENRKKMKKVGTLIVMLLFGFQLCAQTANTPQSASTHLASLTPAEIENLVADCRVRTDSMLMRIFDYTYTHTSTFRERNERGQITRERTGMAEAYPVRGRRFAYVPISRNGQPVAAETIERARQRAARDLTQAEERDANSQSRRSTVSSEQSQNHPAHHFGIFYDRNTGLTRKRFSIIPIDFLQTHEFYAPRRATFNHREAIVLNFRPRTGLVATDMSGRLRARLGGRIWIDAEERILMRLEALPIGELSGVNISAVTAPNANAPVAFEWIRLSNGTWLPSLNSINTYGREDVFENIRFDFSYRLSNFRLFNITIERVEINPPQQ